MINVLIITAYQKTRISSNAFPIDEYFYCDQYYVFFYFELSFKIKSLLLLIHVQNNGKFVRMKLIGVL